MANQEWWRLPAPPLVLLFLALTTMFLFGGDRGYFYRNTGDEHLTWNHMTVAENLAPEHYFLGFYKRILDADGTLSYEPYNRFPVGGHILIKLVTLPFPDDLSARLFAARMLMLTFATAAATLAYLALCRLAGNRWAALAATLLAFSSDDALYYNDLVTTEGVVDLFGVLLVFHGMAVAATENRHGQLLAKTCVALLLGWHVYALIGPFVLFGLVAAWRRREGQAIRRHVKLGVVAVLFGSMVLSVNFIRESIALDGEVSAADELPSVKSMLRRIGILRFSGMPRFNWLKETRQGLDDIGRASVPYAVSYFLGGDIRDRGDSAGKKTYRVLGLVVVLSVLVLLFSPATCYRVPLAALAVCRPCWLVTVPYNYELAFERLFYVGLLLVLFTLMLTHLARLGRGRRNISVLAGVASVPIFALSSLLTARIDHDPERATRERILVADFESIRKLAKGKTIFFVENNATQPWYYRQKFYFTDSIFVSSAHRHLADFIVAERFSGARSLTPDNRLVFLYESADYAAGMATALISYKQSVRHDTPVVQSSDYAVYFIKGERNQGNQLFYLRADCPPTLFQHRRARFFLHVIPVDPTDLPEDRQRYGFDNLDFNSKWYWQVGDECYMMRRLPGYRIAEIRTGQFRGRKGRYESIWEGSFSPAAATDGGRHSSRPAP